MNQQRLMKRTKTIFLLIVSFLVIGLSESSNFHITKNIRPQQGLNLQTNSVQYTHHLTQKDRMLAITSENSKSLYVISSWIKKYSSRNELCHYLCQSESFFTFFSSISCYVSHKCTSIIWQNLIFWVLVMSYTILPILMIVLRIWSFGCWSQYLAVLTGIVLVNLVFEKLSNDFKEDMETDYDISNSQVESDFRQTQSKCSN